MSLCFCVCLSACGVCAWGGECITTVRADASLLHDVRMCVRVLLPLCLLFSLPQHCLSRPRRRWKRQMDTGRHSVCPRTHTPTHKKKTQIYIPSESESLVDSIKDQSAAPPFCSILTGPFIARFSSAACSSARTPHLHADMYQIHLSYHVGGT